MKNNIYNGMDKVYDHKKVEDRIYKFWEQKGYFKANPDSPKAPYGILIPPPNVNGPLHLGHAMQHAIMDAIARFKRMQGFDVLLLPGVDHAGILFEGTLNKILEKEGASKQKLGRDAWMKRAWEFKDENYKAFHDTWKAMGLSADWGREVFTLDPKVEKAVFHEFKTFWDKDLLYKGAYIVQWCPKDQTAIEDLEMEYQERKEKLYFVKYAIKEMGHIGENIVVATARPETIFADTGIAIYPNHPKYKKYIGMYAQNPLTQTEIPIVEDKRVDKKFGTGALKITPGHDLLDYEIAKDQSPALPIYQAIDKNGKMTNLAIYGPDPEDSLEGVKIDEARKRTVEILENKEAIEKVEDYVHSVPVCERCKTTIEPLISEEWFVKMKPLAQNALKNMDKINFLPKNYKKILSDWMKEIHDWSISRSLWWGHRIPVWYCKNCNPNHEVGKDKDMIISLKGPNTKCKTCGDSNWEQDEQVLDTWFSSGLWPMATLGWPEETEELKRYYPWHFELTAPEIKFLWIARMIMLGLWFKNETPFKNMFFHGMLRDLLGRKFSKSLGNGIDPYELRDQWGTDATRMALYSYSIPGRDGKTSKQVMDERAKNYRNFNNKLWNIARFILELKPEGAKSLELNSKMPISWKEDKDILTKLARLKTSVTKNMENYQLHLATEKLYDFVWHEFADKYIEETKFRRAEAQPVLEHILKTCIEMLHPFTPFITEEIYQKLTGEEKSLITEKWPK